MTMSCEADNTASATANNAKPRVAAVGEVAAMATTTKATANWVMTSHARRRPSQGGSKRSMSGAHKNLKV